GDSAAAGRGMVPSRVTTASSATLSGLGLVNRFMAIPPKERKSHGLRFNESNAPGAQTERRGGAGPVRGLLGGKDPTGRLVSLTQFTSDRSHLPLRPLPRGQQ